MLERLPRIRDTTRGLHMTDEQRPRAEDIIAVMIDRHGREAVERALDDVCAKWAERLERADRVAKLNAPKEDKTSK